MPAIVPAANALVAVQIALDFIEEPEDDDGKTADRAQLYINAYSLAIERYTQRHFLPAEAGTSKVFRYDGSGYLSLAPFELRSDNDTTTITLYTDYPQAGWVVLQKQTPTVESQFRFEPRKRTPEGTFTSLTLQEIGQFSVLVPEPLVNRRVRGHQLTIHGDWGIGYVPADVQLACLIAVNNAWRNPEGFQTRQMAGLSLTETVEGGQDDSGLSLPRDARALLRPYRRKARG